MTIKAMAFDCFGTIFSMEGISRDEIRAYVDHVNSNDFSEFQFPESWFHLKAHPDSAVGIKMLQEQGFLCGTLSNGSASLLKKISEENGIFWDFIIDLAAHKVYKPHKEAYTTVQKDTGVPPRESLMVTANPDFGDIEGGAFVGMIPQVIRQPGCPRDVIAFAKSIRREP